MTIGDTVVCVEMLTREGAPTGVVVPVNVMYAIERDLCARQRGVVEVLDIDIAHHDLSWLTLTQVEYLMSTARRHVLANDFVPSPR